MRNRLDKHVYKNNYGIALKKQCFLYGKIGYIYMTRRAEMDRSEDDGSEISKT
jgi:hypothetical protein